MKIEVSNGEVVDKITILRIKADQINDPDKKTNVQKELSTLEEQASELLNVVKGEYIETYLKLYATNRVLWGVEDELRELEAKNDFGETFIQRAREVYTLNDERSRLKKEINLVTGSKLVEEKSYKHL